MPDFVEEEGPLVASAHAFEADEDLSCLPCTLFSWGRCVQRVPAALRFYEACLCEAVVTTDRLMSPSS